MVDDDVIKRYGHKEDKSADPVKKETAEYIRPYRQYRVAEYQQIALFYCLLARIVKGYKEEYCPYELPISEHKFRSK